MVRDRVLTERLSALLAELTLLTANGSLHWERQLHSAHRYARWNDNVLILGPTAPLEDRKTPRYLFLTPFNAPSSIEITSDDVNLTVPLLALIDEVETATAGQEPRDPFAFTQEALSSLG